MKRIINLMVLLGVCITYAHAYKTVITIVSNDSVFNNISFQRVFCGNVSNAFCKRSEPLVIGTGRQVEFNSIKTENILILSLGGIACYQEVLVTPGDSVSLFPEYIGMDKYGYKKYRLNAKGTYAKNYNYYNEIMDCPFDDVDSIKRYKLTNLEKFKKNISSQRYNLLYAEIINENSVKLLQEASSKIAKDKQFYINLPIERNLMSNGYFFATYLKLNYSSEDIYAFYKAINTFSDPALKEYLYAQFFSKWLQCAEQNTTFLSKAYKSVIPTIKNQYYIDNINAHYNLSKYNGTQIPEKILDGVLLQDYTSGKTISVRKLIEKYKGQKLYFDFWASWCSGCIWDIRNSAQAKEMLNNSNITLIQISIDTDETKWRKAVKNENFDASKNFRLINYNQSPIKTYLNIGIPMYAYINSNGSIISIIAPRINDIYIESLRQIILMPQCTESSPNVK